MEAVEPGGQVDSVELGVWDILAMRNVISARASHVPLTIHMDHASATFNFEAVRHIYAEFLPWIGSDTYYEGIPDGVTLDQLFDQYDDDWWRTNVKENINNVFDLITSGNGIQFSLYRYPDDSLNRYFVRGSEARAKLSENLAALDVLGGVAPLTFLVDDEGLMPVWLKDGKVDLTVEYDLPDDKIPEGVKVYRVEEDGSLTPWDATADEDTVTLTTGDWRPYIIVYDEKQAEENKPVPPPKVTPEPSAPAAVPQTGDGAPLLWWAALLLASLGAAAGMAIRWKWKNE